MAKIIKTQELVYKALVDNPVTRADDYILILDVLSNYVTPNMPLETILKHHVELGIPSIETITRCRRRLQKQYPELINLEAKKIRKQEQKEFRQYALNYQ